MANRIEVLELYILPPHLVVLGFEGTTLADRRTFYSDIVLFADWGAAGATGSGRKL